MYAAKATIDWNEGRITFEGTEEFVQRELASYTNMSSKSIDNITKHDVYRPVTPADLIGEKKPKGHHEIVAVLAFAMAEDGKEEFTDEDMRRMYLQARVRPPKVMAQALRDAKNRFDFIEATGKRGVYKLSPHGDRTVRFDLPRRTD